MLLWKMFVVNPIREHTAIYQRIIVRISPSLFVYVPDLFAENIFLLKNQSFWNKFHFMEIPREIH